jgi:hypothetical protein
LVVVVVRVTRYKTKTGDIRLKREEQQSNRAYGIVKK